MEIYTPNEAVSPDCGLGHSLDVFGTGVFVAALLDETVRPLLMKRGIAADE